MSKINEYIPEAMRREVSGIADHKCEYCLIRESDTYFGCEIDHIISVKHGGKSQVGNLAFACMICNRFKGSDLGSLTDEGILVRFYNPRTDDWKEHFKIQSNEIIPLTNIGMVTVRIFKFNEIARKVEREALQLIGHYPVQ
ncbi:HNH endonuclease [Dyadobacter sp. NIV53]|uniref:HNH endonuclease n=1 Tax=Dyadobacter sp. NIV53 TaxID=2861765 RepID=UPI001C87E13D|nr:HNH endonuclease signature motif containing protein [Dyadobacter sp. NIV53]